MNYFNTSMPYIIVWHFKDLLLIIMWVVRFYGNSVANSLLFCILPLCTYYYYYYYVELVPARATTVLHCPLCTMHIRYIICVRPKLRVKLTNADAVIHLSDSTRRHKLFDHCGHVTATMWFDWCCWQNVGFTAGDWLGMGRAPGPGRQMQASTPPPSAQYLPSAQFATFGESFFRDSFLFELNSFHVD